MKSYDTKSAHAMETLTGDKHDAIDDAFHYHQ